MGKWTKCMGVLVLLFVLVLAVPVKAAPAKPKAPVLKGTVSKDTVTLTWNSVKNARGYHLYLYYSADNKFRRIKNISAQSPRKIVLKGSTDHTYRYKICAYNKKGSSVTYSDMSKELQLKTAPRKGEILLVEKRSSSVTRIDWKKNSAADGYQIIRSDKEKGPYKRIAVISGNKVNSYQDKKTEGRKWFYRVRAYRRNPGSVVYGAYSVPVQTQERSLLVIGDSRTVMMQKLVGEKAEKTSWICKVGSNSKWFREEAVPAAEKLINKNSDIVIWMGVNDPQNISFYLACMNDRIPKWREIGARVYIMAAGQVEDDPYVDNDDLMKFNTRMRAEVKDAKYIDLYTYLAKVGYKTTDGTHYESATTKKIYDYMLNNIK